MLQNANVGKLVYLLLIFKSALYGAFVMVLVMPRKKVTDRLDFQIVKRMCVWPPETAGGVSPQCDHAEPTLAMMMRPNCFVQLWPSRANVPAQRLVLKQFLASFRHTPDSLFRHWPLLGLAAAPHPTCSQGCRRAPPGCETQRPSSNSGSQMFLTSPLMDVTIQECHPPVTPPSPLLVSLKTLHIVHFFFFFAQISYVETH